MKCSDYMYRDLLFIFYLLFLQCTVHADPSISTSTPTPCYGDVVTLVCHHPDLASNSGGYITTVPTWRENGVGITPTTGIYLQDDTSEDLTHTTLTINITVDHFRNKSFNYSCFLVLAMPVGELETSGVVTVDPVGECTVHGCIQLVLIIHIILCISTHICMYLFHYLSSMSVSHTSIGLCTIPHTLACPHHH